MIKEVKAPMWDQMQVFCKQIADHQIRFVLHFNAILDEAILKKAIESTLKNNPIAYANFVEDAKEALWHFPIIDIDKVYSYKNCQNPEDMLQEVIMEKLDTYRGTQVKISLIRSKNTDILILNCNHSVTDAAGVKNFMYQLAQNYTNITQNRTVHPNNYMPSRSLKILYKQLSTKEKGSIIRTMLSSKKNAPTFKTEVDLNNLYNPDFHLHTFNPDEFEQIKKFGKQHNATLNDMLLTAYYFALKRIVKNSNKTNRLTYSSDLRKYFNDTDYEVLSNFSAIHNIDINNTQDDFVTLLKEISTTTKIRKHIKYNLADISMMGILTKVMSYKKRKGVIFKQFNKLKEGKSLAAPGLSNTGIIEEQKVSFDTTVPSQGYMLGGINHPSILQLLVSTYKKNLTISIGSYCNEVNRLFLSNLIENIKTIVEKEVCFMTADI